MNLPSFIWLWRIAAWSMGLTVTLYVSLLLVGLGLRWQRSRSQAATEAMLGAIAPTPTPQAEETPAPAAAHGTAAPATTHAETAELVTPSTPGDGSDREVPSPDRAAATSVLERDTPEPVPDRLAETPPPRFGLPPWLNWRSTHLVLGVLLVTLVLLLLTIGIIGTLGHFGNLGHSLHLPMGLTVVGLTLASAWSASRIHPDRPWARSLHLSLNTALGIALALVSWTGWIVVQKYLP